MPGELTLLAPIGLAGLVAFGAIILIHMRRRTPPRITLPSLRFWEPAEDDSADRRRLRKPPLTLPFILQLLAALLIGFALARPAISALPGMSNQRTTPEHTIIVLDGSTSMLALDDLNGSKTRWDLARVKVRDLLDEWQPGDVVTLITVGTRMQSTSASSQPQIERLRERVNKEPAPGGIADIDAALELGSDLVLPDRDNRVVLVTDGAVQASPAVAASVAAPIELIMIGDTADALGNVAVTSIGSRPVTSRDNTYRLSFSISAFAPETVRLPYRVQADGVDVVASEIDLAPGQTKSVEVTLPEGAQVADVIADVRDAYAADNRAALFLGSANTAGLDILLISDTPTALERALGALPGATVDTFPTSTPGIRALAAGFDLVVFQGISPQLDDIPETPMLFVRPLPMDALFQSSGIMSAPSIDRIEAGSSLLDGVDLAGVTFGDTPAYQLGDKDQELVRGTANGVTGPLIWRGEFEERRYVAFGFDLESSNITQRVAFPVLIARSVADLTVPPVASTLDIGQLLTYRTSDRARDMVVTNPLGTVTTLPVPAGVDTVVFDGTNQPGRYVVSERGEGQEPLAETVFIVNAGNLAESDLRVNAALGEALQGGEPAGVVIPERRGLSDIWPVLTAVALVVIAFEWLVVSLGHFPLSRPRWPGSGFQRPGARS